MARLLIHSPRADQLPARPVASARATPLADRAKSATLHRQARHLVIAPPLNWKRIANAAIIAVALGNIMFWGGQVLRMVGL